MLATNEGMYSVLTRILGEIISEVAYLVDLT